MSKRALVTGGAGFIGSHLCDELISRGWKVTALDDLTTGLQGNLNPEATFVQASIGDRTALSGALHGCDAVFHLAANVSIPYSIENPEDSFRINGAETATVVEAARLAGVSTFVFSSSSAVYGDGSNSPKREDFASQPLSVYAAGKLAGEGLMAAYAESFGMSTVSLRYFNVFGPRQRADSPYAAVIPIFLSRMLRGETITVYGDGNQTRDFTYITNVVDANIRAAEVSELKGDVINCACGEEVSINELIAEVAHQLGVEPRVEFDAPRSGEVRYSVADITKSRTTLGSIELVPWREGLRRTIESFR